MPARRYFWLTVFCGVAVFLPLTFAQQEGAPSKKVLTPEQKAHQEQWNAWFANRQMLQAQARQVFQAEAAREKTGDCPNAQSNYDFIVCYGEQLKITNANLASYERIIRELQVGPPPMPGEMPAGPPTLTSDQLTAEFDHVEEIWHQYRESACTTAYHQFGGGTGGPSFQAECELKLTRDHIRELDMIYGMILHL